MGITGLTTYIEGNSDYYLEPFQLRDTYLVIDGKSISSQIYQAMGNTNSFFGGDYDKFALRLSNFFDTLLKCKVKPLVLIDGGFEHKKLRTIYTRFKNDIKKGLEYTGSNSRHIFPMFKNKVFMEVLASKKIEFAQCRFEADNEVAAIAMLLDAPVLSYDSDFYIFGVSYIPFLTLDLSSASKANPSISCKIYKVEKLLNRFEGLSVSTLALAATLLGNDYTNTGVQHVLDNIKLPKVAGKGNEQQKRIKATLKWLSQRTLSSAISVILNDVPQAKRNKIFNGIRESVSVYTNFDSDMLIPLGFSSEFKAQADERVEKDRATFQSILDEGLCEKFKVKSDSNVDIKADVFDKLPRWLKDEFYKGSIHQNFLTMINCRLYICRPQVEDFTQPASGLTSSKIFTFVYKLASSSLNDEDKNSLECWVREGYSLKKRTINVSKINAPNKVPTLDDLTELSLPSKRELFDNCLEVAPEDSVEELPEMWKLFVVAMKFWCNEGKSHIINLSHAYSLILSMLASIVHEKIGRFKSVQLFEVKYKSVVDEIVQERKTLKEIFKKNNEEKQPRKLTIEEALKRVTKEDCIVAAPFFITKLQTDPKLQKNPKIFHVSIVHAFSMFQSCLAESINLNAVLKCPYEPTVVSQILNGTLLYNLYISLFKRADAKAYVDQVFQHSPNLARLFRLIAEKFERIFDESESECDEGEVVEEDAWTEVVSSKSAKGTRGKKKKTKSKR